MSHCRKSFLALFVSLRLLSSTAPDGSVDNKTAILRTTKLPLRVVPNVVRSLPHPMPGSTQGLLFAQGSLFESVGIYGHSEVRNFDAWTGALHARHHNNRYEFGEGLALQGDTLLQLTWREGYAIRLTRVGFNTIGEPWYYSGEGWGLTWMSDRQSFVRSDGTSRLHLHNATSFTEEGTIEVRRAGVPLKFLNELEYARGNIYANLFGISAEAQHIIEINPSSGEVTAEIDMRTQCQEEGISFNRELNGIAYDPDEDVFYVTGKNWKKIYVVRW